MSTEKEERVILGVVESNSEIWYYDLVILPGNDYPVGSIYRIPSIDEDGLIPVRSLSTNDEFSVIWASLNGSIWTASCNGIVSTTANFKWKNPLNRSYSSEEENTKWSAIALPKIKANGLPPNISALWGLNDNYVLAGTYSGHIYLWNGIDWTQTYEGPGNGTETIKAFAGISENDIIAIGQNGCILHFNSVNWTPLLVTDKNKNENFTGIHAYENGDFIISANARSNARVLKGKSNNLFEFCKSTIQLIDLVVLEERVLFATGDGVAELFDTEVRMIKSNFMTSTAWKGNKKVFFIEPNQEVPCYCVYNPETPERIWWRVTF